MTLRDNQKLVVAVVYVAAMFMAILDTTIVNVALPTLGRDLHARADDVGMVSIAYLVSLAVFIPASGWLGDRIGGRRALLGAIAIFTIASGLCGMSTSLDELVAFRVLQGIGGAVMTPVGLAMLFRVYPPAERVRISSVLAGVMALAPALGPILGGVFTTYLSWRLVFFVNVPVGLVTLAFGAVGLADHLPTHPGRLDVVGLALSGLGLGSLMYGISEAPAQGWSSPPVLATVIGGAILLVAMVVAELRVTHPLVDLRLFHRHRLFAAATSLYGLCSIAYLGALYLAAVFLQDALHFSAIQSGLAVFPSAIGTMAGGQLVTRVLYHRVGPRRLIVAGLLVVAATMSLMAQVGTGMSVELIRLVMLGLGFGVALVFIPNQAASMATISKAETGRASSVFNASKQLGGALGVAALTTVVAAVGTTREEAGRFAPNLTAYHDAFLAGAAVALLSVLVTVTISDADAAATMVRKAKARPQEKTAEPALSR